MTRTYWIGLAAAAGLAATPAMAVTTVYNGYDANSGGGSIATNPNADAANASFQSALSGVSTQGFEGFANNASAPLSLSFTGSAGTIGATLTGSGAVRNASRATPTSTDQYAVAGNKYYEIEGTNFTVSFDTAVAAFGFYGADLESTSGIIVTLNYAAGGSQAYNLGTVFGQTSAPSGSVHFLGFIDVANPFTSVVFSGVGASGDILAFDQLTVGDPLQVVNPPSSAVPEPATWAMMLVGIGATGGSLRRRRNRQATLRTA